MRWRLCSRPERLLAAVLVAVSVGCATNVEPPVPVRTASPEAAFVVDPMRGYPRGVGMEERLRLSEGHDRLVVQGDSAGARAVASALLERNPDLDPAVLLLAQADLVDGDAGAALAATERILAGEPSYSAALLLRSRAAEKTGDLALAFAGYFDLTELSTTAARRAEELRPRALEIVANRVSDSLRRGRIEEARRNASRLAEWAPGEPVALHAERDVARASGDHDAELRALRQLSPLSPSDRDLRTDLADLELTTGDPSVGLRIFQDLASQFPNDAILASELARAKFVWRLTLLPQKVRTLVRQAQLSRAEFAAVLYWLFPQVRYGQTDSGTIATDILDHEHRQEIVRVVNLGLQDVDPTLHTYRPDEPQTRVAALGALLGVLAVQEPRLACFGTASTVGDRTPGQLCRLATQCGLLAEEGECLPLAAVSGPDAFEMSRGALGQLGIE